MENEAFSASLNIKNVLDQWALDGVNAEIVVTTKPLDPETGALPAGGEYVTQQFRIDSGDATPGADTIQPGETWTPQWNLVPGSGLGGNAAGGVTYYVQAIVRFQVQGKAGQFITPAQAITIQPAPNLVLRYELPNQGKPVQAGDTFDVEDHRDEYGRGHGQESRDRFSGREHGGWANEHADGGFGRSRRFHQRPADP